mmetsp:Transcript_1871/g.3338  ORF Transcript_1871/g.3338 Transcript_1871/m.3338 type:complete len:95 (-) Transcript_1871:37-321(-)
MRYMLKFVCVASDSSQASLSNMINKRRLDPSKISLILPSFSSKQIKTKSIPPQPGHIRYEDGSGGDARWYGDSGVHVLQIKVGVLMLPNFSWSS